VLKYFFFLNFALFIFSQSFFDVYKRDLPKSVLEGKHKIENIEILVNEYAEISPILVFAYLENLEKISLKQKAEINLTQLRNTLLSVRKEWVENLLKNKRLSDETRASLNKLYSAYSFSEIHPPLIDLKSFRNKAKFKYVLAKHLAHEDFGEFNSSLDYDYFVTIQSKKRVNFLNRSFEDLEDNNITDIPNIEEYLYLVVGYPENLTKIKTEFMLIEFYEAEEEFKNFTYSKSLDYYKENLDHPYSISVLIGSSVGLFAPKILGWSGSLYEAKAKSVKVQFAAKWNGNYNFDTFSYIRAFVSYDISLESNKKYDVNQFEIEATGPTARIRVTKDYTLYHATQSINVRAYGEINHISQLEYGINAPLFFSSLWSKSKKDYFIFEFGFGLRHRFFSYTANTEIKTRIVSIYEYHRGGVARTYGNLSDATEIKTEKKDIHEIDFIYDFGFFLNQ
jgi:hypothetical protein